MNARILVPALLLIAGCRGTREAAVSPSPEAMPQLAWQGADAVLWQNTSAEVYWLYRQGYDQATDRLELRLQELDEQKQMGDSAGLDHRPRAVIVDIDETVLDNSPYQVNAIRRGRTFDQNDWREWTDKAAAKACPGAVEFLVHAEELGCEVFYITNRDVRERASTLKNLNDLRFPFADEAHLLLMDGASDKTERRARVMATHNVLLLVGDQLRDFSEAFKDRSGNYGRDAVDAMADSLSRYFILLPNPMYGSFRDAVEGKGTDAEKLARRKAWFESHGY